MRMESKRDMFSLIENDTVGTTTEEVVSRLREMIHQGDLRPGDRLPPWQEREDYLVG